MNTKWSDDYVTSYNAVARVTLGSAPHGQLILVATVMAAFKRLVEYVLTLDTSHPLAPSVEGIDNPFDLAQRFNL